MARTKDKDRTSVTLITTDVLTPYRKGEVFTVEKWVADQLLDDSRLDADNHQISVKVEIFDPKRAEHAEALAAQRGKAGDVAEAPKAQADEAAA